jgi:hypothetical protein
MRSAPLSFFHALLPFTPEELSAVDLYVTPIERPPNRYRKLGAPLNPAQRRGKAVFERTTTNDGRMIPVEGRCVTCHFPPYFTDRQVHDVGTGQPSDRQGRFDTPHLNNIYDSAPYLHNGMAATLEEIWTVYNPDDKHGVTNDMTKDQLNDLIEVGICFTQVAPTSCGGSSTEHRGHWPGTVLTGLHSGLRRAFQAFDRGLRRMPSENCQMDGKGRWRLMQRRWLAAPNHNLLWLPE